MYAYLFAEREPFSFHVWKPGFVVANGNIVADKREGEWKSTKPGYVARLGDVDSVPQLVWQEGLAHPQNARLKSGPKEGDWLCSEPGWKLTNGLQTVWQPGIRHPVDSGLVAEEKEDQWKAVRPGYVWDGESHAVWKPGSRYPGKPFVAGKQEGEWESTKPGYVARQDDVGGVPQLVWHEGLTHLQNKRLKSGSTEGDWLCVVPGWKWTGGSQTEWQTGVRHPSNSELISDAEEDRWKATRPGYAWNGGSRVVWKPGTMDGGRKASRTPDEWLSRCSKCDTAAGERHVRSARAWARRPRRRRAKSATAVMSRGSRLVGLVTERDGASDEKISVVGRRGQRMIMRKAAFGEKCERPYKSKVGHSRVI